MAGPADPDGSSQFSTRELEALYEIVNSVQQSAGSPVSQWVVIGVLCLSVLVALASLASQRVIAKKRAAYDYMVAVKADSSYLKNRRVFVGLVQAKQLEIIVGAKTEHEIEQREAVRSYLNFFELLCVSIEMRIIDEDICKAYLYSTLVKRWNDSIVLIEKIKNDPDSGGSSTTFRYFRTVAERWEKNPELTYKQGVVDGAKRLMVELTRL